MDAMQDTEPTPATEPPERPRSAPIRALAGAWAALIALAPHVLHHVGPLAGAALLAGVTGQLVFAALGLVLMAPMLLRIRRRTGGMVAPALLLAVFAAMWTLTTLVIAPQLSGHKQPARPDTSVDHDQMTADDHDRMHPDT
jgi:hypothetical protein